LSSRAFKRESILFSEGISSRAEYEVARAEMLKDKANLDSLKIKQNATLNIYAQRVALYGGNQSTIARVAATGRIYPFIILRANKHGVILERLVNQGEIVNQNKELVNLADLSTIWLVGYAFERDTPFLHIGQNVTGIFEEQQQRAVHGVLSYVASILEPEKKTMEVIADIPNKDYAIKPNMYAEMVVDTDKINVLAVPNTALQQYGDYTFAFVKTAPHTYVKRKVEVGQSNDNYSEVKSGLNLGESVVSSGAFSLLGESIKKKEE
jgi:multidrug efflux pump subunit AcrA (membrane-fusion protein)